MKIGSIVYLSDEQTLEDQMSKGSVASVATFTVSRFRKFTHENGISWEIIEFEEDPDLFLIKKSVDNLFDWFVYFRPEHVEFGSRKDFLDDNSWIFDVDYDQDFYDINPDELDFAEVISDDGLEFRNSTGTMIGDDIREDGGRVHDEMFLITEWEAENNVDNPFLLALETSSIDEGAEGFVLFLQGCIVSNSDVKILN